MYKRFNPTVICIRSLIFSFTLLPSIAKDSPKSKTVGKGKRYCCSLSSACFYFSFWLSCRHITVCKNIHPWCSSWRLYYSSKSKGYRGRQDIIQPCFKKCFTACHYYFRAFYSRAYWQQCNFWINIQHTELSEQQYLLPFPKNSSYHKYILYKVRK